MNPRQRTKAVMASAVFPGVGQFIAGEPLKGGLIQVMFIGLLFGVVLARPEWLPWGLLAPGFVWLYSVLDLVLGGGRTDSSQHKR